MQNTGTTKNTWAATNTDLHLDKYNLGGNKSCLMVVEIQQWSTTNTFAVLHKSNMSCQQILCNGDRNTFMGDNKYICSSEQI